MKVWAPPPVGGGLGLGVDKVDKEQIRVESEYKTRSCCTLKLSFKLTQEVS